MLLETMTAAEAMQQGEAKAQPLDVSRFKLSPWAKWVAADRGGDVFEYEAIPVLKGNVWIRTADRIDRLGHIDMTGIDWHRTLTPVNQPATTPTAHSADVTLFVTQLQALTADQLVNLARQLAQADPGKANLFAEMLWGNAMDAEHARLQADDAVMESSDERAVWGCVV